MTTTLEEFLIEHNRLSPAHLQATKEILLRFRDEKRALFQDNDWSIEKIRRPFIIWLYSASLDKKRVRRSNKKSGWIIFPQSAD